MADYLASILKEVTRIADMLAHRAPLLRIGEIHIINPNGETLTMSGSQTITLPAVTLNVPDAGSSQKPGYATFPITLTNPDGTPPTLVSANNLIVTTSVTGPNPDGSYTGVVTAVPGGAGQTTDVNVEADGAVDTIIPFSVVANPNEFANVDPTKIVVTAPQ